ncbi:hypothetical protein AC578_5580 [Pseudocercospora eumusae]|uniref:RRM domain-containing protein n=1 Tax=Pseudocercospora eumusae TaxID=321146 RepID=A0A139HT32_9PEZI|nr:hypothetical protein AC578_5580 [Pseudocercospora eumusae]
MGAFLARPARVAAVATIFSRLSNTPLILEPPPQAYKEDFTTSAPPVVLSQAFPYNASNTATTSSQVLTLISSASGEHNANPLVGVAALVALLQTVLLVLELIAPTGSAPAEFCRVYRYVADIAGISYLLLASFGLQFASSRDAFWTIAIAIAITTWRRQARAACVRHALVQVREVDLLPRNVQMVNGGTQTAEEPARMKSRLVQTREQIPDPNEIKRPRKSDRQLITAQEEYERISLALRMRLPMAQKALKDQALQLQYDERSKKCEALETRGNDLEKSLREKTNALDMKEYLSGKLVAQTNKCQDLEAEVIGLKSMLEEKTQALSFKEEQLTAMTSKHSQKVANLSRTNAAKDQTLRRKAREASRKTEQLNENSKALSALEVAMTQSEATKHADMPRQYEQLKADYEGLSRKEAKRCEEILQYEQIQKMLDASIEDEYQKNEELGGKVQALSKNNSNISLQLSNMTNRLIQRKHRLQQVTSRLARKALLMNKVKKTLLENFEISEAAADYLLDQGDMFDDDKRAARATLHDMTVKRIMHRKDSNIISEKAAHVLVEKYDLSEQDAALLLEKGELNEQEDEEGSKDDKAVGDHEPRNKDGDDDDEDDDDHDNGQAPKVRSLEEKASAPTEASRPAGGNDAGELGHTVHDGRANQMEYISFQSSDALGGNDKLHTDISKLEGDDGFSAIDTNDAFANQPGSHEQSMEDISFENGEPLSVNDTLHANIPKIEHEATFSAINTNGALSDQPESDEQSKDVQVNDPNVHDNDENMGIDDEEDPAGDLERAFAMDTDGLDVMEYECEAENAMNQSTASRAGSPSLLRASSSITTSIEQRPVDSNIGTLSAPNTDPKTDVGSSMSGLVQPADSSLPSSTNVTPLNGSKPLIDGNSWPVIVDTDVQMSAEDESNDNTNMLIVGNFPRGTTQDRITTLINGDVGGVLRCEILSTGPKVTSVITFRTWSAAYEAWTATEGAFEGNHKLTVRFTDPKEIRQMRQSARHQVSSVSQATGAVMQHVHNDMTDESDAKEDEVRPCIVIAKNFPSSVTEQHFERNMKNLGCKVSDCRILATEPLVTAKITFGSERDAKIAIAKLNGRNLVNNKLHLHQTDREGVKAAKQDAIAARTKLGGDKVRQLQGTRAAQMGSSGEQTPLGITSTIAATMATNTASTAAPPHAPAGTLSNDLCYWKKHEIDENGNVIATYPCTNGRKCTGDPTMYDARGVVPLPKAKERVWLWGGVNEKSDRFQKKNARDYEVCFACWKVHPKQKP